MKLAHAEMECFLPIEVESKGPFLEVLTPVVNFGIVASGSKKIKTIAIKNIG